LPVGAAHAEARVRGKGSRPQPLKPVEIRQDADREAKRKRAWAIARSPRGADVIWPRKTAFRG
jgi:hypothetical protein